MNRARDAAGRILAELADDGVTEDAAMRVAAGWAEGV